ncbi:hypothetical protein DFH07DRAFT_781061 [Mycena maculata]|uniref:Uncharacterized protein n=1 Tax=Mycena maculata TaxID=230809 RepID=A0AAD7HZW2_9AGAR|nr:hypothetical protein DFH07DRAFT_781061 [Mycena maculata]
MEEKAKISSCVSPETQKYYQTRRDGHITEGNKIQKQYGVGNKDIEWGVARDSEISSITLCVRTTSEFRALSESLTNSKQKEAENGPKSIFPRVAKPKGSAISTRNWSCSGMFRHGAKNRMTVGHDLKFNKGHSIAVVPDPHLHCQWNIKGLRSTLEAASGPPSVFQGRLPNLLIQNIWSYGDLDT